MIWGTDIITLSSQKNFFKWQAGNVNQRRPSPQWQSWPSKQRSRGSCSIFLLEVKVNIHSVDYFSWELNIWQPIGSFVRQNWKTPFILAFWLLLLEYQSTVIEMRSGLCSVSCTSEGTGSSTALLLFSLKFSNSLEGVTSLWDRLRCFKTNQRKIQEPMFQTHTN